MNEYIKMGTKKYFVGTIEIDKPINHGWSPEIFKTLCEQAGYVTKEWNDNEWVIIPNS